MNSGLWFQSVDKWPDERKGYDLCMIATRLRSLPGFQGLHPRVILEFSKNILVDAVDGKITLFREGEERLCWFYILQGEVEASIKLPARGGPEEIIKLCTMGFGCSFGFSLCSPPHHSMTMTTTEPCTLIRMKKDSYRQIWSNCSHLNNYDNNQAIECGRTTSIPSHLTSSAAASSPSHLPMITTSEVSNHTRHHERGEPPRDMPLSSCSSSSIVPTGHGTTHLLIPPSSPSSTLAVLKDRKEPSAKLLRVGWILKTCIMINAPHLIKTRKTSKTSGTSDITSFIQGSFSRKPSVASGNSLFSCPSVSTSSTQGKSMIGSDLVDWLMSASTHTGIRVHSRSQATSMWQVLFEEGVILPVEDRSHYRTSPSNPISGHHHQQQQQQQQHNTLNNHVNSDSPGNMHMQFEDKFILYGFWFDFEGRKDSCPWFSQPASPSPYGPPSASTSGASGGFLMRIRSASIDSVTQADRAVAEREFGPCLSILTHLAPDANLRTIFRKDPSTRTDEEISLIFEELMRIQSLSHLTASIKRELAHVVSYEYYPKRGEVVFNQGDFGSWWYLIYRGCVDVEIVGKGRVCTLSQGDEFGKLALVNNAPRAATIITAVDNTQFFKVHKDDFNRILCDVEANTIRLQEHNRDVLILMKLTVSNCKKRTTVMSPPEGSSSSANLLTANDAASASASQQSSKLLVIAGTPEKMIEYCLESRFDMFWNPDDFIIESGHDDDDHRKNGSKGNKKGDSPNRQRRSSSLYAAHLDLLSKDTFFEDFILTYLVFISSSVLCHNLLKHYKVEDYCTNTSTSINYNPSIINPQVTITVNNHEKNHDGDADDQKGEDNQVIIDNDVITSDSSKQLVQVQDEMDFSIRSKKRVVRFVYSWRLLIGPELFFTDASAVAFVNILKNSLINDNIRFGSDCLKEEISMMEQILLDMDLFEEESSKRGLKKLKSDLPGIMQVVQSTFHHVTQPIISGSSTNLTEGSYASSNTPSPTIAISPEPSISRISSHFYRQGSGGRQLPQAPFKTSNHYNSPCASSAPSSGASSPIHMSSRSATPQNVKVSSSSMNYNAKSSLSSGMGMLFKNLDPIRPRDEILTRIYCADHTYTTVKYNMTTSVARIKEVASEKLIIKEPLEKLLLVEVRSSSERVIFADSEISVGTGISVNGRIFIAPRDHLDALTPLPEQEGPKVGTYHQLDDFTAHDLAYHLTHYSWALFNNVHEVFGRKNFKQITSNLDLFLRHFEEVQYWVTSEIVLCSSVSKRVQLLRKFIKTAGICKEYQNLHTFFAITLGLSNVAVTRLTQTWEKLPSKVKRIYSQFESLIDPSRNHRRYRLYTSKLEPPVIPFTPLLLKDMTFAHEGNKTFIDKDLINFEKMQMLAQAMRTFRFCRSKQLSSIETIVMSDPNSVASSSFLNKKMSGRIESYIKNLRVIDSQRILTSLSHNIETVKK